MVLEKDFLRWRVFCISRSGSFITTMVHKTDSMILKGNDFWVYSEWSHGWGSMFISWDVSWGCDVWDFFFLGFAFHFSEINKNPDVVLNPSQVDYDLSVTHVAYPYVDPYRRGSGYMWSTCCYSAPADGDGTYPGPTALWYCRGWIYFVNAK